MYQNKVTNAFIHKGNERKNYPLIRGIYKLEDAKYNLEQLSNGVNNIINYRLKKTPYLWSPCYPNEISYWLRNMPIYISEDFGYNVVPALNALRGDGLSNSEYEAIKLKFDPLIYEYVDECARFYETLKQTIRFETSYWPSGKYPLKNLTEKGEELIEAIRQDALHRSNV